jgi:hypothetical protein
MQRTHQLCPFARYAAVVHCRSGKQAEYVMQSIVSRLTDCRLTIHPDKSKVVYCKDSNHIECYPHMSFTFLGFTFRPRKARSRQKKAFTSFLLGASDAALKRGSPPCRWGQRRESGHGAHKRGLNTRIHLAVDALWYAGQSPCYTRSHSGLH